MKEELKEKIRNYIIVTSIVIIIILIIIIGFVYGNKTTKKVEEQTVLEKEKVTVEEEKNNYIVEIKGEVKNPGVYELEENKRINDVIKLAGGTTKNASTDYINLSKKIKDEMVIIIYSKKEIEEYNKSLKEENVKEVIKYEIIEKECVCPNTLNDACIEEKDTVTIEKEESNSLKEYNKTEENNSKEEDNKIEENEKESNEENKLVNINIATINELQTLTGIGESKAKSIIEYREKNKFMSIEDIKNVSGIGDSLFEKIKDYITI